MHPKVLSAAAWKTVRKLVAEGSTAAWTLAGGTALALQFGHRYSEDLDFFRAGPFDAEQMLSALTAIGDVRVQDRTADTLHVQLDGLRVSYLKAEVPFLFPTTRYRGLRIADPRDIAVMKVIAIGGRGSRKDFVDLYFLLRSGVNLRDILALVRRRFARIDYNEYHLLKSLAYFADAEAEPAPDLIRPVDWKTIKTEISGAVRSISA
jgi:hypothetical protein